MSTIKSILNKEVSIDWLLGFVVLVECVVAAGAFLDLSSRFNPLFEGSDGTVEMILAFNIVFTPFMFVNSFFSLFRSNYLNTLAKLMIGFVLMLVPVSLVMSVILK